MECCANIDYKNRSSYFTMFTKYRIATAAASTRLLVPMGFKFPWSPKMIPY